MTKKVHPVYTSSVASFHYLPLFVYLCKEQIIKRFPAWLMVVCTAEDDKDELIQFCACRPQRIGTE